MHGVRRAVLDAQVAAIGLPLVEATIPAAASNPIYEEAFATALVGGTAPMAGRPPSGLRRSLPDGRPGLPRGPARAPRLAPGLSTLGERHRGARAQFRRGRIPGHPHLRGHDAARRASSPAASSTPRCWRTCRPASIPAGSEVSFIPVSTPGRSFAGRSPSAPAGGYCATAVSNIATWLLVGTEESASVASRL